MKIAFDARVISDKMHGMARYAYNLILNLAQIDAENKYVLISGNEILNKLCEKHKNVSIVKCNAPLYSLREQIQIPLILRKEKPDLFHSPTFSTPMFSPCKTIITVHDLIHLVFGGYFHKLYYRFLASRVKKYPYWITSVSEYSKKDITNSLGISRDKVFVTHIGVESKFCPNIDESSKKERYILFVGNSKPHKNLIGVLNAFNLASQKSDFSHFLTLVGINENDVSQLVKTERLDPQLNKKIIIYPQCSEKELIQLYQSADLFLAPSLLEGFGLPMLEAMACGTPVITSNCSSIPEVVGNGAILVDPKNTKAMADWINDVLNENAIREEMIQKGIERAKMFSWEKTARKTLELYRMIHEKY
jgi:glycosyltransferase involved in cell wall biosynthesis